MNIIVQNENNEGNQFSKHSTQKLESPIYFQIQVLIAGIYNTHRKTSYVRNFIIIAVCP
jgi:hypothetical protein